jgi:hypothetical protein
MANPTTYFGWVMPTSSSLVTNLPADFNTFGQGVDTSLQDLLGGTTGQVLSKTSGTNMDFTWVTPTDQTPLTTKGDLFAFSTVDARLPAGANETRLVADSAQTLGLKYVADTTNYAIAAKADLLVGTAADTLAALTVGTDGQVLTADSTVSPTGLKWATPSSGTPAFVGVGVKKSANQSIANATFTAITFNQEDFDTNAFHDTSTNNTRITIPAGKAGYYAIAGIIIWSGNGTGNRGIELQKNGASVSYMNFLSAPATNDGGYSMSYILNLAVSDYVELFGYQTSGGALNIISAGTSWQMQYLGA